MPTKKFRFLLLFLDPVKPSLPDVCLLIENNRLIQSTKFYIIMDKYVCEVCGWVYDPAVGHPEHGIEPGTPFEEIPDDWVCPLCGVGKDEFTLDK